MFFSLHSTPFPRLDTCKIRATLPWPTYHVFYRHLGAAGINEIISCHTFFLTANLHKFGVRSFLKRNAMFYKETCDVYTLN